LLFILLATFGRDITFPADNVAISDAAGWSDSLWCGEAVGIGWNFSGRVASSGFREDEGNRWFALTARCAASLLFSPSQRPVDAFIPMDWCSCLCADRLFGVCLLGQVQVNLQPQLMRTERALQLEGRFPTYRESVPAQPVDATPSNQLIPQYFL